MKVVQRRLTFTVQRLQIGTFLDKNLDNWQSCLDRGQIGPHKSSMEGCLPRVDVVYRGLLLQEKFDLFGFLVNNSAKQAQIQVLLGRLREPDSIEHIRELACTSCFEDRRGSDVACFSAVLRSVHLFNFFTSLRQDVVNCINPFHQMLFGLPFQVETDRQLGRNNAEAPAAVGSSSPRMLQNRSLFSAVHIGNHMKRDGQFTCDPASGIANVESAESAPIWSQKHEYIAFLNVIWAVHLPSGPIPSAKQDLHSGVVDIQVPRLHSWLWGSGSLLEEVQNLRFLTPHEIRKTLDPGVSTLFCVCF
mmetsp:Transcript_9611/g.18273  ORF Transcript_9611/g.18273 Transcript_9611/m.18273 type:complete len:304 (+) Transcript_9611:271-1182(+)